ncbi:MAG: cation transporter [Candidatus Competibacter phosphatis]
MPPSPPGPRSAWHSYGLGRAEFLAALINSLALLILVAWIAVSAVQRLHQPQPVIGEAVSVAAAIGLATVFNVKLKRMCFRASLGPTKPGPAAWC